ncbi:hypothetical protein [Spirillospora sp. NBC_01491]|uniref:hypothetical protein n=1 Tax=Spirillospora sp. NBC_01491 TaxID=2976007 RepID=UPI002E30D41C|nr:hypothetical protein [Spirillospora sp. NBC_01491]
MYDSIVRTVVPLIVGVLVGQAARIGLDLDATAVTAVVTPAVTAVYYAAARWIETRYPAAGRVLLSLGLARGVPAYVSPR